MTIKDLASKLGQSFAKAQTFVQRNPTPYSYFSNTNVGRNVVSPNLQRLRSVADPVGVFASGAIEGTREALQPRQLPPLQTAVRPFLPQIRGLQNLASRRPTYLGDTVQKYIPGNIGLAVGGLAEFAAPNFIPTGEIKSGGKLLSKVLKGAAKSAPIGALFGAANAENLQDLPQKVLQGAKYGAAFGGALGLIPRQPKATIGKKLADSTFEIRYKLNGKDKVLNGLTRDEAMGWTKQLEEMGVKHEVKPVGTLRSIPEGALGITTNRGNLHENHLLNRQSKQLKEKPQGILPIKKTKEELGSLFDSSARNVKKEILQPQLLSKKDILLNEKLSKSLDEIIDDGKKEIKSGAIEQDKKPIKQIVDDLYTQWIDRYNPIIKASRTAKEVLGKQKASLRPEYDPEVLVRRLTGAGGIADARFQNELKPIIDTVDNLKIDKSDLDVYLANRRIAGFGKVGRDVYGADPKKAQKITQAVEEKYGDSIKQIADQLYGYQNKGFQEMVDAGFISPESSKIIQSQNPDYAPLQRVMDEVDDYLGLPTRKTMQGSQPIKGLKGSKRQIESPLENIIANTFKQRAAIEKNRVAKSIVGLQQIAPSLSFGKVAQSGNDTITVWNNGQKEYWKVGKDIADVAKGVNEETMNIILKVLQVPASILRQGATGRNIEFMIPNIIRDQIDAGISSKYGYLPAIDWLSGMISLTRKDDIYKKFMSSGARIDLGEMSRKKSISQLFNEKTAKRSIFDWISSGLDVAGTISEQPTRLGLFKKAYRKTNNELLALMESRDATIDFARMGSKMKVANSIIPFLNVGVQGFDKLIRSVKNNPGRVAFFAGIYGAIPQIVTTIHNLQNFPEEYKEIPQFEKDNNFILIEGRNSEGTVNYKTIPKGNIVPIISNPIQSFIDYTYGADNQSFQEMATNVLSEALPVLSPGNTIKEVATKTIGSNLPQAVKPLAENLINKSFFKYDTNKEQAKEIVPYYLQDKSPYEQKYEFTPQMYQKIGAALNVSPLQVQNLAEGYFAGYAKIPAQIVQMLYKTSRGDEISPNDKPILRRFIKQTYEYKEPKLQAKPESPGLMERLLGKAKASSVSEEAIADLPSSTKALSTLYKSALTDINNYEDRKTRIAYGNYEDWEKKNKLSDLEEEYQFSKSQIDEIKNKYPEKIFDIELPTYVTGGSANVEERGDWAIEQLKNAKQEDLPGLLQRLWDEKVLTTGTKGVAEYIKNKYGISVYTKSSGGSGGKKGRKPPKITIKKVTPRKLSLKLPAQSKVPTLKLKAPPKQKLSTSKRKTKTITVAPIRRQKLVGLTASKRLV